MSRARRSSREIATGASPHLGKWFAGAGVGTIVVQGPGELLTFDPATQAPGRAFPVGKQPHWMASDGKTVWVTNEGSNDVSAVDLASGTTTTIAVGNAPRKIVVQPVARKGRGGGRRDVSIANFAFAPSPITIPAARPSPGATTTARRTHSPSPTARRRATCCCRASASRAATPRPERFDYVCSVHPYMTGQVTVRP